jgi:hypothetical protein
MSGQALAKHVNLILYKFHHLIEFLLPVMGLPYKTKNHGIEKIY